ncbi:hypothetical protein [Streptomyces showdoensis]|uniref:hypothetical protein n=1 Tax=Streptomyces showdoensis TaxID=68268 RepID=UPI00103AE019|nr:hypothetical protein [Streptomyces showdoensis]
MDSSELAAAAVTSLVTALASASAAAVVNGGGTALTALVRGVLARSPRGQAALTALEADPGDTGARTEAETVLVGEIDTDPDLRTQLNAQVDSSSRSYRDAVVITGSRVSRSHISLGPLTVNNTAGGRVLAGVVVVLAIAVLVLALYGVRQLVVGDDTSAGSESSSHEAGHANGDGGGAVLTDAQISLAMPQPSDLPRNWAYFSDSGIQAQPDGCRANGNEYEVDGGSDDYKIARFILYACPSEDAARAAPPHMAEWSGFDGEGTTPEKLGLPKLGDESTALAYAGSSKRTIVITIREKNTVMQLQYKLLSNSKADEDEAFSRALMAHDRLKSVQAGTLRP